MGGNTGIRYKEKHLQTFFSSLLPVLQNLLSLECVYLTWMYMVFVEVNDR